QVPPAAGADISPHRGHGSGPAERRRPAASGGGSRRASHRALRALSQGDSRKSSVFQLHAFRGNSDPAGRLLSPDHLHFAAKIFGKHSGVVYPAGGRAGAGRNLSPIYSASDLAAKS